MKQSEVRKFLDEEVVGQLHSGLFFEAFVKEKKGKPIVVGKSEETQEVIDYYEIKWLTPAQRYC